MSTGWRRSATRSTNDSARVRDEFRASPREHDLSDPGARLDDFVGTTDLVQRKNLVDEHLQLAFGGNLKGESEIVGRIDRVSEDRNHVEVEIFHVERNAAATVTTRGDEA